jgi:hypothetical protein
MWLHLAPRGGYPLVHAQYIARVEEERRPALAGVKPVGPRHSPAEPATVR